MSAEDLREDAMTGKTIVWAIGGALCVGIFAGGLTESPTGSWRNGQEAWAQGTVPIQPPKIDRSLPGMRKGVLTKVQGETVWIDGDSFTLAPRALVENRFGNTLEAAYYQASGVRWLVEYWLVPGQTRHINQMIITFPE
jgi:hypothetical protein